MKTFAAAFLFLFAVSANAQTVIKGTVTDANGGTPILAQAHVGNYHENAKKSTTYTCAKDGSFEFTLPKPGMYSLRVSAVNHEEATLPLVLREGDKNVELNVQLKPNPFNKSFDQIVIIGDWNKFDFSASDTMTPTIVNGKTIYTYQREATGDTLSYQLLGIAGSHSVNGTTADYYTYDGGGDYRSVVHTRKGEKVTITFDPSKLNFAANENLPSVTVKNNSFLQKAIALTMKADAMFEASLTYPTQGGPVTMSQPKYQKLLDFLKENFEKERTTGDALSAQFAGVTLADKYSRMPSTGADIASEILTTVPASCPFWTMSPFESIALTRLVDSNFGATYRQGLEKNPEKGVRANTLSDEMQQAFSSKDEKEGKRIYTLLKKDYSDVPEIKYALNEYDPDAPTQVGKHVPAFDVAMLGSTDRVSDKSMLGKYYMIDFWATWCGPCVGEMPAIHKAYERFKGRKGFEIVSLSMDASEKNIAPFRANKWPMPWINAFIPGVWDADIAKEFEVSFIPDPILVGPDGTILARQEDLRGDKLEQTLGKYLGESD